MKIKIRTFGSVAEILGTELDAEAIDTDSLIDSLCKNQPMLDGRKLLIAVNNTVIQQNTALKDNDVVAIMPPYSGG